MKLQTLTFALMITLASPLAYAQGGGGGGGAGGGSAGGASAGGAAGSSGAGVGTTGIGSRNAPQGTGTGVNPATPPSNSNGVANAPGQNPSTAPGASAGTTTGLANPQANSPRQNPADPGVSEPRNTVRGTNSLGTANASGGAGGGGSVRSNGTRMPGPNAATTTRNEDSDAVIDAENRELDRKVKSICRGC
jgi:hypothetical protein